MQTIDQNIWIQDKAGNFSLLNVAHDINLDYETNSIRFRIQANGFLHGYVVGKFNNWQKQEELKLTWTIDSNDGSLWLTKDIFAIENLNPGTNQYSFILVDLEGSEFKVSINDNDFIPLSFNWLVSSNKLEIKSSENFIALGYKVDLAAVTKSVNQRYKIVDVDWEISLKSSQTHITNNKLFVDPNISKETSQINIKCFSKQDPSISAEKSFDIVREQRHGALVHFIKKDGLYHGENFSWDLWTYSEDQSTEIVFLSSQSDFGVYAICNKNNVIARKKTWSMHWHNEWAEQTNSFDISEQYNNYYIIQGDAHIYTSLIDVINRTNPKIEYTVMDQSDKIKAYLSDKPQIGTLFELWINSSKVADIDIIIKEKSQQIIFTNLPSNIKGSDLIEIRANNIFLPTKVLMGNYLDKFYYPKNDMGVIFNENIISLRLWAPTAKKIEVLLYNEDSPNNKKQPDSSYELIPELEYGTHHVKINRSSYENKYYLYKLYFDDLDPRGNIYTKITYAVDPYTCGLGINGDCGFLVDLNNSELMPEKWLEDKSQKITNKNNAILYEVHLRDFTISPESGIDENLRGKFLGAVEENSIYADNDKQISTGIDSLVELGITHIHLLPIFDFSSVDEKKIDEEDNRNWGYDPKNYNAPDGCYSLNPYDPTQRIKGVREMVLKFHQKGIGVVMDMVYNHMTDTSNLDKIVPKYYFRTDKLGNFTNGSGCGNELATEHPMVSKFIQDSVVHWIKNYKINGVRFDLMELIDLDTIKNIVTKIKQVDPNIIIYGEPWKADNSPLTNGTHRGTQRNQDFSIFNDSYRDAIRGNNNPGKGFINGNSHNPENIGNVIEGLRGSIHNLTAKPNESINYVDAHDNYTLWDQIEKSQNHNIATNCYRNNLPSNIFENTLVRQNALALGIILTSQGIPFIHGGAEFLRTKQGDHNSYKSDDEINAFHWSDKLHYKEFFNYVKGLIKLRKEHPVFRINNRKVIDKNLNITTAHHDSKSGVIISHFKNYANGDSWKDIIIVYNATAIDNYEINDLLPKPDSKVWYIVANHEQAGTETIQKVNIGKLPSLRSHSLMIIHS
ncbi:type I pullulanase [Francisella halioticida]|uniref:Type I pullulanase n=1 Tax=Francisella halioticida TaxID=549298 RepID=A0ABM6M0Y1_9GAMM|nr:type I pullulanase [Francisella halioticida]ASG68435.1 type I pullulanase [Francisella halioticida]BCD91309.1 type I pullulanase [Francisella halioticida]